MYLGQSGLLLLYIDPEKVDANIVYEDLNNTNKLYPHIFGPLNLDAEVKVVEFAPKSDGTFDLLDIT